MKDLYLDDVDFGKVYKACENLAFDKFYKFDGYLFKEKKYYVLIVPYMNYLFMKLTGWFNGTL